MTKLIYCHELACSSYPEGMLIYFIHFSVDISYTFQYYKRFTCMRKILYLQSIKLH